MLQLFIILLVVVANASSVPDKLYEYQPLGLRYLPLNTKLPITPQLGNAPVYVDSTNDDDNLTTASLKYDERLDLEASRFGHKPDPADPPPESMKEPAILYTLYTKDYYKGVQINGDRDFNDTVWITNRQQVIVIIHTIFLDYSMNRTHHSHSMKQVVKAFLKLPIKYNVILIDWAPASLILPFDTKWNARNSISRVAQNIVIFFDQLIETKRIWNWSDIQLVGFGVGAYVAGEIGYLSELLGGDSPIARITAVNPYAGFYRYTTRSYWDYELYRFNADYVDMIHCDMSPFVDDLLYSVGHVHFFPHGGQYQPGCEKDYLNKCNHDKCLKYLARSIDIGLPGCRCRTWEIYKDKQDTERCRNESYLAIMGPMGHPKAPGRYYLKIGKYTEEG